MAVTRLTKALAINEALTAFKKAVTEPVFDANFKSIAEGFKVMSLIGKAHYTATSAPKRLLPLLRPAPT